MKFIKIYSLAVLGASLALAVSGCGKAEQEITTEEVFSSEEETTTEEIITENNLDNEQNTERLYQTENEIKEYIENCTVLSGEYRDYIRYEDDYKGNDYVTVIQVTEVYDDGSIKGVYGNELNEVIINDSRSYDTTKILKDDIIRIYGKYEGAEKTDKTESTDEVLVFTMYAADILDEITMPGADTFSIGSYDGEGSPLTYLTNQLQVGDTEDLYAGLDYAGAYDGEYNVITVSMYTSDVESDSDPVGTIEISNKLQGGDTLVVQGDAELYHDFEAQNDWGAEYDALYTFTMDEAICYIGLNKKGDEVTMKYMSLRSEIDNLTMTEHYVP